MENLQAIKKNGHSLRVFIKKELKQNCNPSVLYAQQTVFFPLFFYTENEAW